MQFRAVYGNMDPKDLSRHKCRTLAPIFTKSTLFSPELKDEPNKIIKF